MSKEKLEKINLMTNHSLVFILVWKLRFWLAVRIWSLFKEKNRIIIFHITLLLDCCGEYSVLFIYHFNFLVVDMDGYLFVAVGGCND